MVADFDTYLVVLADPAWVVDFDTGTGGAGEDPTPPGPGTTGPYLLWRRRRGAWRSHG